MTRNQFNAICEEYMIDPAIALENDNVCLAIVDKDENKLREILENEF